MRTISPALLAHLQGDVKTIATLWLIQRTDGQTFGFTDLDQPITFGGVTYQSTGGYTHSNMEQGSDLSTANLEMQAVFDNDAITPDGLESGVWDYANVTISLVNYADLTMGSVILNTGVLGAITIKNGAYTAEMRGLAQVVQQDQGDVYTPLCRATFGDAQCKFDASTVTFSGSVQSLNSNTSWNDPTLTQTGPAVPFTDTFGHIIPTQAPFTLQMVPPTGGAFVSNISVIDDKGNAWTPTTGPVGNDIYQVNSTGLYTFDGTNNPGQQVFINYEYEIGYFAYGTVKFTSGANAGQTMEVKSFSPGVVTLAMSLNAPIAVGDTYTIVAGCDKQCGTCSGRFNNLVNFRGEPYIPGADVLISPKS